MERRRTGQDLGRGKLSTVGVAHPGFQFIFLYTINRQSRTQLSSWRRLHNIDDSFHAITCILLLFAFAFNWAVGTGTRDYFVFIPLRLVTQ